MSTKRLTAAFLFVALSLPAWAASSTRQDDLARIHSSARVFSQVMHTPDKGIPQEILEGARCIAIIPGEKKLAFVFGGSYGKGLVTCRDTHTASGWTAPLFITVGGGSWGAQIGGQSSDIVLIIRSRHGAERMLSNKFKIGVNASAAAGPVGRHVSAETNPTLNAEILSYSRSKGAFAGVSLAGAVVQPDATGNRAMYGRTVTSDQVLNGHVRFPAAARDLAHVLTVYTRAAERKG